MMLKRAGFLAVEWLAPRLSCSAQYAVARPLAALNCMFNRPARKAVLANMTVVAGAGTAPRELRRLASRSFQSFGMNICEFFGRGRFDGEFLDNATIAGVEHLDGALAQGRGALLCTAHYSNWELGAAILARRGYPVLALARPHDDPSVDAIFNRARENRGYTAVPFATGARAILRALKKNHTAAILADRPTGGPMVDAQLFGKTTQLPQGPWRLALMSGAALLPCFARRKPSGGFEVHISAALTAPDGPDQGRISSLAQKWAISFEAHLRHDPAQWVAFHPVWENHA